LTINFLFRVLN